MRENCLFLKVLDAPARERLVANIAGALVNAQTFIQDRAVNNFSKVHADFGTRLRKALDDHKKQVCISNSLLSDHYCKHCNFVYF